MADELQFIDDSGLTITASVYTITGTALQTGTACAEQASTGIYSGDIDGGASADTVYNVVFNDGTNNVGGFQAEWNGTKFIDFGVLPTTAEINTEVDTALTDIHLDHLLAADYDPASKPGTSTALLNEIIEDDGGVSRFTSNALEQGPNSTPQLLQSTTIATLTSQTEFTLTAGSGDDDAYNNSLIIITDQSTSTQKAIGSINDYTGSTKTVELVSDPAVFTMATGDTVDIIAGVLTAAGVWTYASRTLTSTANVVSNSVAGTIIQIVKDVTFDNTWSSLTIPATWSKVYFTVKADLENDADTASLIQAVETNPSAGGDGLLYINGAAATASDGSITVDQGAGTVQVVVADDAIASLEIGTGHSYDLKVLLSDGTSQLLLQRGGADIVYTPTRAIT